MNLLTCLCTTLLVAQTDISVTLTRTAWRGILCATTSIRCRCDHRENCFQPFNLVKPFHSPIRKYLIQQLHWLSQGQGLWDRCTRWCQPTCNVTTCYQPYQECTLNDTACNFKISCQAFALLRKYINVLTFQCCSSKPKAEGPFQLQLRKNSLALSKTMKLGVKFFISWTLNTITQATWYNGAGVNHSKNAHSHMYRFL